jgi:hypothetical protein
MALRDGGDLMGRAREAPLRDQRRDEKLARVGGSARPYNR